MSIRTDVTDLELAQEKLARSLRKLESLDQRRNNFIKIASHELRTPVTVIRGYASMIEETWGAKSDADTREYAENILQYADKLIHIINDMLELTKMEFEEVPFHKENRDLSEVTRDVAGEYMAIAKERGVTLRIKNAESPIRAVFDFPKIRKALSELVANAIKFTPSG